MNNYAPPLQGTANNLAKYGRYGDSMLVHMNPIEVQGIAALSPTGRLTTNPVTGQQEAFLPFLAPLLGGFLGLGAGGSALLSGALTTIASGDLKKGILSGLTSFGLGKIFDAIPSIGEAVDGAGDGLIPDAINPELTTGALTVAPGDTLSQIALDQGTTVNALMGANPGIINPDVIGVGDTLNIGASDAASDIVSEAAQSEVEKQGLFGRGLLRDDGRPDLTRVGELSLKENILPGVLMSGTAGSELARIEALEDLENQIDEEGMGGDADRKQSEEEIARAYAQIAQDYPRPYSSLGGASVTKYVNSGGLVSLNPMDYQNKRRGLARLTGEPIKMANGGSTYQYLDDMGKEYGFSNPFPTNQGGGYTPNIRASRAQSDLRGSQLISAPQMQQLYASGYRPGFSPELQYFRTPDKVYENDPFGGFLDPMNPNAPVLPTEEQIAQTVENERLAKLEEARVPTAEERRNYFYPNNFMGNMGTFAGINEDGEVVYDSNPITPAPVAPVPVETLPSEPVSTSIPNQFQDFDFSSFRDRLDALENKEIPDYTAPDLSSFITADDLNTRFDNIPAYEAPDLSSYARIKDIPTYDDSQLREEMNTRFGSFSNFDPAALQEQIAANQAAIQEVPQFDDTQLRQDINTRFGRFSEDFRNQTPASLGVDDKPINTPTMPLPVAPVVAPSIIPPRPTSVPAMQPPVQPVSSKPKRSDYGKGENAKYKKDLKEWSEQQKTNIFGSNLNNFRFNSGGITNLAEGGLVKMQDMGQVPEMPIDPAMMQPNLMEEGIAAVDPAMADPVMADPMAGIDPAALQLMEQTAMAVLGQVPPEQADAIIQAFIQQFGSEAFQMLRQQVLASVEPNAQTEGMIAGQGDGMSDEIMGSIGDQQRVAVSPGEFIVPADVVSGIGNGSSDAGANELNSMMDEIRQARTGMTEQPPAIDPRRAMPV